MPGLKKFVRVRGDLDVELIFTGKVVNKVLVNRDEIKQVIKGINLLEVSEDLRTNAVLVMVAKYLDKVKVKQVTGVSCRVYNEDRDSSCTQAIERVKE